MKRYFIFIFFLLSAASAVAQIQQPAFWRFETSEKQVKVGEEVDLIFKATIDKDWYLYSSDFDPELGPQVTTFVFEPNDSYELVGEVKPVGAKTKYDEIWEGDVTYFTKKAEFRQTVKILKPQAKIKGTYEYQVCTDVTGQCIPFEDDFSFNIKTEGAAGAANSSGKIQQKSAPEKEIKAKSGNKQYLNVQGYEKEEKKEKQSLWGFMIMAFLSGLAALMTPCVFPMIPMTVTFFTKGSATRKEAVMKALGYGASIVGIYTLIGLVAAPLGGPDAANVLSTHWLPNALFFVIFLVFALSFFGLFEITLPSNFVNKIDQQADKGGYYGIFFMALTLVVVSFSCTGPIAGSILFMSFSGEVLQPVVGMFGYSLAFAIPFTLFAIFPEWLNSLPKSGGWLNSVKVVLGFVELALALKFLSVIDQVYHLGILDREIYLAIWIVVFTLLGFYLLGKLRLPHDSPVEVVSVPRLMLSLTSFAFVVYMIPGMWGAPLKALAGYLPPATTQDFDIRTLARQNNSGPAQNIFSEADSQLCEEPKYADIPLELPHGIEGYFDLQQAMECAKKQDKPIFIDFTGHGCVNCRKMEENVWADPQVLKILKEEYVVVALYVDERHELPDSEWYTSPLDGKVKKTIGKQNADFQAHTFNVNAQPYYVLLDANGNLLTKNPKSFDMEVDNFVNFLKEGLGNFKKGRLASK